MENQSQVNITFDVLKKYYDAMRCANDYFDEPLKEFKTKYPLEYKRLNSIHVKRNKVNSNMEAMMYLNKDLYFGTLTYDETKDRNQIDTKRKEAFMFLNSLFDYVLLVEEYGETKERYHVHFVGTFREGKTFNDFISGWHSRQNIEKVRETKKVSQYLCKYLTKTTPRIRRNKRLIALEREHHKRKRLKRSFPSLYVQHMNEKITQLSIFDL